MPKTIEIIKDILIEISFNIFLYLNKDTIVNLSLLKIDLNV